MIQLINKCIIQRPLGYCVQEKVTSKTPLIKPQKVSTGSH